VELLDVNFEFNETVKIKNNSQSEFISSNVTSMSWIGTTTTTTTTTHESMSK
jgi:hypothetical protein